jgi:DNA end-binding protein Ku
MPRSLWKGSIAFGLVQIPVGLYPATESDDIALHMLDKRDFSPVGYERINKSNGKKVPWDDVVRGYEYRKGKYVALSEAELVEANVEATQTIDILDFVSAEDIEPVFFDRPYYVAPVKSGRKAYGLLRETLKRSGKAAIAKVVIRTRQHVAALLPRGAALVLILLRFGHEIRPAKGLELPENNLKKLGVTPKEISMAERLVGDMVGKFEPEKYRDEYRDDLLALIKKKAKAGEVNTPSRATHKPQARKTAQVIDLMELLKQSVNGKHGHADAKRTSTRAKKPARKARSTLRKSA